MAKKRPRNKQELSPKSGAKPKKIPKKAKKIVKSRVEKPYNAGTQTSAAFFGMLKAALRRLSMYWKPVSQVRDAAKRKYHGPNKRQIWEYKCASCENYYPAKEISVDHKIPVGTLSSFEEIGEVAKRLFVEKEGLQCLCNTCHLLKSKTENSTRRELKKQKNII